MFKTFERFLKPTATPEHPEPPAGLLGFLWHFARQAKPLFLALFVVEFFVALTDAAIPWFGDIVTLACRRFRPIASSPKPGPGWSACCDRRMRGFASRSRVSHHQQAIAPFSSLIRWQ
jgi:ATP-binding cassette subfamily B multidrug efflux pump